MTHKTSLKIALIGYGKMGKAIEEVAISKGHQIAFRFNSANKSEFTKENLATCDVAIEFTGPETAPGNLQLCFEAGVPVICGTTGWLQRLKELKSLCQKHNSALLYASNFSIGVNIFFEINRTLARLMGPRKEYVAGIEETHHLQKKDAPSGTSITLAEDMLNSLPQLSSWTNHPAKDASELFIKSNRVDSVPGTHVITYKSDVDELSIAHIAHNRRGFAEGAMAAAEFLIGKRGIYQMSDVLKS